MVKCERREAYLSTSLITKDKNFSISIKGHLHILSIVQAHFRRRCCDPPLSFRNHSVYSSSLKSRCKPKQDALQVHHHEEQLLLRFFHEVPPQIILLKSGTWLLNNMDRALEILSKYFVEIIY